MQQWRRLKADLPAVPLQWPVSEFAVEKLSFERRLNSQGGYVYLDQPDHLPTRRSSHGLGKNRISTASCIDGHALPLGS
jgi:hypothetical protein